MEPHIDVTGLDVEINGDILPPGFHNCTAYSHQFPGFYAASPDPYTTLGQQIRAELDREAEAVAYLEARGYKVIKKEGAS